ncbi:hypothetical protein VTN77DRAFT_9205 [Rasamsonia byssochlamydoides]|uniref:uncharacterized protein n=1 Tax=Rasamsonia byssochlamydoides TaxID=89139 RepID=UPI00374394CF
MDPEFAVFRAMHDLWYWALDTLRMNLDMEEQEEPSTGTSAVGHTARPPSDDEVLWLRGAVESRSLRVYDANTLRMRSHRKMLSFPPSDYGGLQTCLHLTDSLDAVRQYAGWAHRRARPGPGSQPSILYLYVPKGWIEENKVRYLTTAEFQELVWWSYRDSESSNATPDFVKAVHQRKITIGPISAVSPAQVERMGDSNEILAATFGTWSKCCKRIKKPPVVDLEQDFCGVPLDRYVGRWIFLNTTYGDFSGDGNYSDNGDLVLEDAAALAHSTAWMILSPPSSPSSLNHAAAVDNNNNQSLDRHPLGRPLGHPLRSYPEVEQYLLNYFIQAIGPNCSLSASYNPYLSLVTPLCFSHTTLKNTLLAVSANQLRLLGDTRFVREAWLFKDRALQGLRQDIRAQKVDYGTVATVLMLCFHDISDGCAPSWITHLRGGLQMTHHIPSHSSEAEALKRFFNMYFVAHDIMGRTAFEDKWDGEGTHEWLENDDLEEIDTTMSCSRGLMSLISRISSLARERTKILRTRSLTANEIKTFVAACEDIEASLRGLNQKLPSYCADTEYILQIAEAKRLTTMLYLKERLGSFFSSSSSSASSSSSQQQQLSNCNSTFYSDYRKSTGDVPGNSHNNNNSNTTQSLSLSQSQCLQSPKHHLVNTIISLIAHLPKHNSTSATILWPLFVIGHSSGLDDEEQRRFVLDRLRGIQQTRNLGSVRRALMAVEHAFRTRDLDLPRRHGRRRAWGDDDGLGVISLA